MAEENVGVLGGKANIDPNRIKTLCYDIQTHVGNMKNSIEAVSDFADEYYSKHSDDAENTFVSKKNIYMSCKEIILYNAFSYIDEYNAVVSKFKNHDISTDLRTVLDEGN